MIASLLGKIGGRIGNAIIIEVNGVGYLVHVAASTLANIGIVGDDVRLLTITQVREDAITLFGFQDENERDTFQLITKVQGVGANIGLSLISMLGVEGLLQALAAENRAAITQAHGVGPKLAARLVTELKDKVMQLRPDMNVSKAELQKTLAVDMAEKEVAKAALKQLGYSNSEINNLLQAVSVMKPVPQKTADILQACLKIATSGF